MRFICLLSIFLISQLPLTAQDEYPFIKEGAIWTNYYTPDYPENTKHFHYAILGDTLIEAVSYKKVLESTDEFFSMDSSNNIYKGAIREVDKRVLYIEKGMAIIDTLYDFNLEIGIVYYELEEIEIKAYLKRIDTIQLSDGLSRKKFIFHKFSEEFSDVETYAFSWIDGIGSTEGFFGNSYCNLISWLPVDPQCSRKLLCFQDERGDLIYTDSIYYEGNCAVLTGNKEIEVSYSLWEIFPNPIDDILTLKLSFNKPTKVNKWSLSVFDYTGKMVYFDNSVSNNFSLSFLRFPRGFYIIRLQNEEDFFIKQMIKI